MPRLRHLNRSILSVAIVTVFASVVVAGDQEQSVQKLLERGALEEAVERAEAGNSESTYLAAFALVKMNNTGAAIERYGQLREQGDDCWKAIGEAGAKLLARDVDGAMEAANRAVSANEGNPYAHYQLGIVAARQDNWERSLEALTRTTELKPDFAYAYYYAAQAAQRLKQTSKAVEHYTHFIRMAPDAPERPAVQSLLRSLR